MKLAILDDYQRVALGLADWAPVAARAEIRVFHAPFPDAEAAAAALADVDIVCAMRERLAFTPALLARLPRLRCLITTGSGNAAIDLDAATRHGVTVCGTGNGPGQRATAELTWGLILAGTRRIAAEDAGLRAGHWQTAVGTMLHGRTLGIVGLGHIGALVAGYARAFGMEVLAWSPRLTEARAFAAGARRVELDELLAAADIVTVHVVLNGETRGLIGARQIALMKPAATLVNTSRGAVIDEAALVSALRQGRIAGAALDVFGREPVPADHPLLACGGNVVLTPHIGFVTEEVYRVFYGDTAAAALAFLEGRPIRVLNSGQS